jgi:hypothetical protein
MKKLLLLFACAMFLAAGALAQATTWYVDANYEGGDSNGTEAKPYVSIQEAIHMAGWGDEILVAPGSYPEVLTITKSIAITGVVDGENRPVVSPTTEATGAKVRISEIIRITTDEKDKVLPVGPMAVNISGLELDGMGGGQVHAGIFSWGAILQLDNVIIHNIQLMPLGPLGEKMVSGNAYGVRINGGQISVKDSWIYNIKNENMFLKTAAPEKTTGVHAVGIYALGVEGLSVTGTEIYDIHCASGDASGISVHKEDYFGGLKDGSLPDFEISENSIQFISAGNYAAGIYSLETTGLLIHDNIIEDIGGGYKGLGIVVEYQTEPEFNGPGKLIPDNPDVEISANTISRVFSTQEISPPLKAEKNQMDPFTSFGIHADTPGKLFIHGNKITSAFASTSKGVVPSGPGTGIFFLAEDVHLLDNEIAQCQIGAFTFFAPNLLVENNIFEEPIVGVFALDIFLRPSKKSDWFDFPFKLPEFPGIDFAKAEPIMGSLAFVGNIFTGMVGYENAGIAAMVGNAFMVPEDETKGIPTPRFIAQGNLIENFMEGISLMIAGDHMVEINGQNIIQNNLVGVFASTTPSLLPDPLVHINQNTIQGNAIGVLNESWHGPRKLIEPSQLPFDARFNYWGTEDGPGFVGMPVKTETLANGVSEGVWYSPWLGFPPDTNPGDMTYYVDDTGNIQDAIDLASPGDIIRVLSGDYEGDIVVGQGDGLTLYPGDSPACVEIFGDLTVASGNTLTLDINGIEPACLIREKIDVGMYTQVLVYGEVDLGGITLDLNLGFVPEIGNEFEIIVSDNPITGMFSQGESITVEYEGLFYTFEIFYNPTGGTPVKDNGYSVVLTLDDISEPLAVPLSDWAIALGMLLMAGFMALRFRM